jgi:hypothetical protein
MMYYISKETYDVKLKHPEGQTAPKSYKQAGNREPSVVLCWRQRKGWDFGVPNLESTPTLTLTLTLTLTDPRFLNLTRY